MTIQFTAKSVVVNGQTMAVTREAIADQLKWTLFGIVPKAQ